jgi:hypothetical protein
MMAAAKRAPLPAILLANHLLDGDVVFLTTRGWATDHRDALVAHDDVAADALEAEGRRSAHLVVDPYLVDVEVEAGVPTPRHFRERMRLTGPSHRADLARHAAGPAARGA